MGDTSNLIMSWRSVMMVMVCLPIVISAALLFFKRFEVRASRVLAVLLVMCVMSVGPQIIGFAGFYDVWPGLTFFPFNFELWIGPLFYLHAFLLIKGGTAGKRLWILLPGLIQTAYYCWAFLALGDYQQKWDYSRAIHSPYIDPVENILAAGFMVLALFMVWKMSRAYKAYLQQTQSAAIEFEPVWLDRMIIAMVISAALFAGLELTPLFTPVSYIGAFPVQVALMATVAWLSIEAVWRLNQAFPKLAAAEKLPAADTSSGVQRDWQHEGRQIEAAVLANQWFLEPRFSLKELAKRMASNEAYVSRAINQGLKQTFNGLINRLRVQHAQDLIRTRQQPLLNIALESGFNSKATFNRVFRDLCGMTPSQYKKSAR